MLDATVFARDVSACILDWPVTIRLYFSPTAFDEVQAGLNATDDQSILYPAALLDQMTMDLIVARSGLTVMPYPRQRCDVLQADQVTFKQYEVKRVPDANDPIGVSMMMTVGSPDA